MCVYSTKAWVSASQTPIHNLTPLQGIRKRSCQKHKYVTRNLQRYDFYLKRILLHTATDVSSRSNNATTKRSENKAHGENTCATHADCLTHSYTKTHVHSRWHAVRTRRPRRERTDCKIFVIILLSSCQAEIMSLFSDWHVPASQSVICLSVRLPAWLSWPALSSIVLGGATTTKGSNNGWLRSFSSLAGFICCIRSYLSSTFHVCIRVCVRVCTHTLCIEFDIHKYIFDTSVRDGSSVSGSLESQKSKFVAASMWLCDPCVSNK